MSNSSESAFCVNDNYSNERERSEDRRRRIARKDSVTATLTWPSRS